jgi:thymidine phosphorylase
MLPLARVAPDEQAARILLTQLLENGQALRKFEEFVLAQGGNSEVVRDFGLLPQPGARTTVISQQSGYVQTISTAEVGLCSTLLGAGREHKGQQIDLAAGLVMACRLGDKVEKGQSLAELFAANGDKFDETKSRLLTAIQIGPEPMPASPLVYGVVDEKGFHQFS